MSTSDRIYMIVDDSRRINPADPNSSYQPYYPDAIPFYESSLITPLIDGDAYFADLYDELTLLTTNRATGASTGSAQRIYLANWVFNKDFELANNKKLTELLRDHAADGVDVRVLLWLNEGAFAWDYVPIYRPPLEKPQRANIATTQELRTYPNLEQKVMLNVLDHLYGSSHTKMAFVADTAPAVNRVVAYTGGIDFGGIRKGRPQHPGNGKWHDIQARIEGDATVPVFEFFKAMWDELVDRRVREESRLITGPHMSPHLAGYEGTTRILVGLLFDYLYAVPEFAEKFPVGDVIIPNIPTETKNTVQSLRTVPDVSRHLWAVPVGHSFPAIGEEKYIHLSSDVYEIYLGFKCAIAAASTYIYIENSVLHSRDLLVELKNAIVANSELKVILLTAAGVTNFSDDIPYHNYYLWEYLYKTLNPDQRGQVVLYKCLQYYTHAKVMIVDDKFVIIGSANISNKSFFSDLEHSISFIDNDGYETVKEFRQALWGEHFRTTGTVQDGQIAEIDAALHVWNALWGVPGASFQIPGHLELTAIAEPAPDFGLGYYECGEEVGALPSP
jgi:phosphatidylserine/phosphatidylglycerophosphate/cardiolipin synthase-like enzyme